MNNLSPEAIAAIRDRAESLGIDWAARTDDEVLATLQADATANPASQGTIPRAFTLADLVNRVDASRRGTFRAYIPALAPLVMIQDRSHIAAGISAALAIGDLTQSEADAILTLLSATDPDPDYSATVPNIDLIIGRPVNLDDVAAARPGA